jgi:hypothetical protein
VRMIPTVPSKTERATPFRVGWPHMIRAKCAARTAGKLDYKPILVEIRALHNANNRRLAPLRFTGGRSNHDFLAFVIGVHSIPPLYTSELRDAAQFGRLTVN